MGNASSSKRSRVPRELERFVKPTGLYPACAWDERQIRRLILDGKIAPRLIGFNAKYQGTLECPICFLQYCAVNTTACCNKPICSECYLQVSSPRGSSPCPFCNNSRLQPLYGIKQEDKMIEKARAVVALHDRISESEEKGVSLVPIVSGPCDEGVDVGDAHVVYANAPLATVDDRRLIEAEVRQQFDLEQQRPEVMIARHGGAIRTAGGRRTGGQRRAEGERRSQGDVQSMGMPSDSQYVEELLLMEAIRQSMEDHARARSSPPIQQQAQAADLEGLQAVTPGMGEEGDEGGEAADVDTKAEGTPGGQRGDESQAICHMSRRTSSDAGSRLARSSGQEAGGSKAASVLDDEEAKDEGRRRTPRCHRRSSASSTSSGSVSSAGQVMVLADGANLISSIRMGTAAAAAQHRQQPATSGGGPTDK